MSAVALKPESAQIDEKKADRSWTDEHRAAGRRLGNEAQAFKASELRVLWRKLALKGLIENYYARQHLSRNRLVNYIREECVLIYGCKGKGGGNIKRSTVAKWLTEELEEAIRLEAIDQIIARAVSLRVVGQ